MLKDIIMRAKADPAFNEIHNKFAQADIENWLNEEEKALHFAVGAFAPGNGTIVEIGSYQGGSACFLAAGIARRGHGKLTCVDPFLGGPPWLGMAPWQHTLEKFRQGTKFCGVDGWIEPRMGDSTAVAAVWPAEPISAVFIDGDHSFLGALKDFENWAPKLHSGGLVLVDDADDPMLPELLALIEFLKTLCSVTYLGTVEGVAVFERSSASAVDLLAELSKACAARGIRRTWDMLFLHETPLPASYGKSMDSKDYGINIAYQLCFLARCGPGAYGYTAASPQADRVFLHALSKDRADGEVTKVDGMGGRFWTGCRQGVEKFRAILCRPKEVRKLAPRLLPGGVLIARASSIENQIQVRSILLEAGLEGCGYHEDLHWGVWQPHHLSPEAILHYAAGTGWDCLKQDYQVERRRVVPQVSAE